MVCLNDSSRLQPCNRINRRKASVKTVDIHVHGILYLRWNFWSVSSVPKVPQLRRGLYILVIDPPKHGMYSAAG